LDVLGGEVGGDRRSDLDPQCLVPQRLEEADRHRVHPRRPPRAAHCPASTFLTCCTEKTTTSARVAAVPPTQLLRGPTGHPPTPLPDQTTNLAQPVRGDPRHPALLDQPFQYPGEPLGREPLASRRTKHEIFGIPGR